MPTFGVEVGERKETESDTVMDWRNSTGPAA